ncbi:MAG: hypothetical protein K2X86_07310 [Cytophagaceae bacterium]|nr:hypothetical protein [Cytophagaceae bacterium]
MSSNVQEPKKGGGKRGLIIAFIIILLAINGVQLWLNLSKTDEIEKKDMTIAEQKIEITNKKKELDQVIADLEQKKQELAALGADTTRLGQELAELKKERNVLAKQVRINKNKYDELEARIFEANKLRDQAEAQVAYWKNVAAMLDSTNRELKAEKERFIDSLKRLNFTAEQLQEKVAIASVMRAENIKFEAVSHKGKAKAGTEFKAKALEKLRITFNLGDNKIAKIENKVVYLRVVESDGSVLFDETTGGGTFEFEGKQIPYTAKTDILFDNKKPQGSYTYIKGSPYKPGKHTIELYCEGFLIGQGVLNIKK